jgi:hypothetical protein
MVTHHYLLEKFLKDAEGIQTMRSLGKNLSYFLKVIEAGKEKIEEPNTVQEVLTNFVRDDLYSKS